MTGKTYSFRGAIKHCGAFRSMEVKLYELEQGYFHRLSRSTRTGTRLRLRNFHRQSREIAITASGLTQFCFQTTNAIMFFWQTSTSPPRRFAVQPSPYGPASSSGTRCQDGCPMASPSCSCEVVQKPTAQTLSSIPLRLALKRSIPFPARLEFHYRIHGDSKAISCNTALPAIKFRDSCAGTGNRVS